MRRVVAALAVIVFIGLCGAAAVFLELREYARTPAARSEQSRIVVVDPGQSLAATAASLHREGLIHDAFKFKLLARLCRYDRSLKAGEYSLRPSMTPLEILACIEKGLVLLHRLTVPEGLTLVQIADLVAKAGLGQKEDFIRRATDPEAARSYGVSASSLEGYLFPETYSFPKGTSPDQLIAAMVQRFRTFFPPQWEARAAELGMNVHEIVTLASIIEKETSEPSERPIISSVFHNRLKRGMRLETDPTVIYGVKNFDGNLTRKHLETPNPYNTYLSRGLPPGPIANPGREALEAALYPARTDYLFFVSKNNGTHHFSISLSDHHRAVRHYQPGISRSLPIHP